MLSVNQYNPSEVTKTILIVNKQVGTGVPSGNVFLENTLYNVIGFKVLECNLTNSNLNNERSSLYFLESNVLSGLTKRNNFILANNVNSAVARSTIIGVFQAFNNTVTPTVNNLSNSITRLLTHESNPIILFSKQLALQSFDWSLTSIGSVSGTTANSSVEIVIVFYLQDC